MQTHQNLNWIIDEIARERAKSRSVLAVFDIDSTLLDVTPRMQRILELFQSDPDNQLEHAEHLHYVKNVQWDARDWDLKDPLQRAGWVGADKSEFYQVLKKFWEREFFANQHLHLDQPYPGALQFIHRLLKEGAAVSYLTGRDVPRMWDGSLNSLQNLGFPVDQCYGNLVLKPRASMEDAAFKSDWIGAQKDKYDRIFVFENEPVNLLRLEHEHPDVDLIFFDSTHSRKAQAASHWKKIGHFEVLGPGGGANSDSDSDKDSDSDGESDGEEGSSC